MPKTKVIIRALIATSALIYCVPIFAQPISTANVIKKACLNAPAGDGKFQSTTIARENVLFWLLVEGGIQPTDSTADANSAVVAFNNGTASPAQKHFVALLLQLQEEGGSQSNISPESLGLKFSPMGPGRTAFWLNDDSVKAECIKKKPGKTQPFLFRLREKPEDLVLTGDKLKKAASATIGYKRERTILEDGSVRNESSISFKGALGYPLLEDGDKSLFIYGGYEFQRLRTNPPPQLTPPASQRDKDTEILQVGAFGGAPFGESWYASYITTSASYVYDAVKKSERLRMKADLTPSFGSPDILGVCAIDRFISESRSILPLSGRCNLTAMWEVNHFLDRGNVVKNVNNEFVLGGFKASIDFRPKTGGGKKSGVVAGTSYQFQKSLAGNAKDIDRFQAYLKYRYWTEIGLGLDFGFDFVDGTNPDSFVDENRLQLGFGLLF